MIAVKSESLNASGSFIFVLEPDAKVTESIFTKYELDSNININQIFKFLKTNVYFFLKKVKYFNFNQINKVSSPLKYGIAQLKCKIIH